MSVSKLGRVRAASEAENGDPGERLYLAGAVSVAAAQVLARIRMGTPWVDRPPLEIVRSNIRFSLQPVDAPPDPAILNRLFDHMQLDELILFSSDYPHWQFEGDDVLPEGLSSDLVRKIMIDNPFATYGRLKQSARETTP